MADAGAVRPAPDTPGQLPPVAAQSATAAPAVSGADQFLNSERPDPSDEIRAFLNNPANAQRRQFDNAAIKNARTDSVGRNLMETLGLKKYQIDPKTGERNEVKSPWWEKGLNLGLSGLASVMAPYYIPMKAERMYTRGQQQGRDASDDLYRLSNGDQAMTKAWEAQQYHNQLVETQNTLARTRQFGAETDRQRADAQAKYWQARAEIQRDSLAGTLDKQKSEAFLNMMKALGIEANGAMTGPEAYAYRMAHTNDAQEIQRMAQAEIMGQASKIYAHPFFGSTSTNTETALPNGNKMTQTTRTPTPYGPALAALPWMQQIMQGGQSPVPGQQAPQGGQPANPLGNFGMPSFGGAPAQPHQPMGSPAGGYQRPQPQPQAQTKPQAGAWPKPDFSVESNGNVVAARTLAKEYTDQGTQLQAVQGQRANLANAIINGTAGSFQGPLAGTDLMKSIRGEIGNIRPNEANQRVLDYESLFGRLRATTRGAFKQSELTGAAAAQGSQHEKAINALLLHSANELDTQAQMARKAGQLRSMGITPEELNDASLAAIDKYARQVAQLEKLDPATRAAYLKQKGTPSLQSLPDAIAEMRATRKPGNAQVKSDLAAGYPGVL